MPKPRIHLARMSHETNTFSPVVTDLPRFSGRAQTPPEGQVAYEINKSNATCLAGFIAVCERDGVPFEIGIAAGASPSGPVENDAFEYMCERILRAARSCDGMMLELHGAMVTKQYEDGEGELLRRIHHLAPELPIAVALDMHANLYDDMIRLATVVTGYHKYPHIDMFETGFRAADILLRSLRGEIKPCMYWGNVPMLPHVMRQGTDDFPNKQLQARAAQLEAEGVLAVSLFTGFPHADIRNAGLSVVVVTDNNNDAAQTYRDELLDMAWQQREAFVYRLEPIEESMQRAQVMAAANNGPVILLDHYDNCATGGTMDTTEVLAEIIRQNLEDVAVFAIYDPAAVDKMAGAGVGAELTIELGGKTPMPSLPVQSSPIKVTGRVKAIVDGRFKAIGPANRGLTGDMGKSVVLDTGKVEIVVISTFVEPTDPAVFTSVGIVPEHKRYLMLKSRVHYRRGFVPIAAGIVECAGVGVCTSDYNQLQFKHVRRPVYPLDGINSPQWRELV